MERQLSDEAWTLYSKPKKSVGPVAWNGPDEATLRAARLGTTDQMTILDVTNGRQNRHVMPASMEKSFSDSFNPILAPRSRSRFSFGE